MQGCNIDTSITETLKEKALTQSLLTAKLAHRWPKTYDGSTRVSMLTRVKISKGCHFKCSCQVI